MTFVHEETVSARLASEMDGQGHFNIILTGDGYQVHDGDGGMLLSTSDTLEEAVEDAKKEARDYDRATIRYLRRKRAR